MKNKFKYLLFSALCVGMLAACDDDTNLPGYEPLDAAQDFNGVDNTVLDLADWKNYAEAGSALWKFQVYSGNGYAEFTSFQAPDAVNIGWLISPKITLTEDNLKTLRFQ